jgi:hypothetical protein
MLVDFDYILSIDKQVVKGFSLGYLIVKLIKYNKLNKLQRGKLKNYQNSFYYTHKELEYYKDIETNKVFVDCKYFNKIISEIKKILPTIHKYPKNIIKKIKNYKKISINELFELEKERQLEKERKFEIEFSERNNDLNLLFEMLKANKKIIIFDMEFWEDDMYKILEIAIGNIKEKNDEYLFERIQQYIVKDNIKLKNTKFVKNNKFNSVVKKGIVEIKILEQKRIFEILKQEIDGSDAIIIHGPENDIKILEKYGIKFNKKIFDTSKIGILYDKKYYKSDRIGLDCVSKLLNKNEKLLHNAASDIGVICELLEELKKGVNDGY